MTSIALYRKYRSQTFEELLGQEHVTETLQASIKEDRVGHAYLFSGPRGTGKTSTARILAKALNCEKGTSPTPCNACDTCRAITEGNSFDVIEIDAASHGGVDDVRELRDNAVLSPAMARRKIYIVDEAHMVSTQGWNAFLKTVEEPPEHVIFVFATTEPHKVLPTILSRCQRFDFRRISSATLADHLAKVCAEEGITADEGALQLIARAAEGGARDALSTLDQLASTGSVTMADAARLLGAATGDTLFEFVEALASADTAGGVRTIARLIEGGQDLRVFARNVVEHLRALLLTKQIDDPGDLIDVTVETRARLSAQAERFGGGKLVHLLRLFTDALTEMRQQAAPRLTVELAVVRATMPEVDDTAAGAIARIERLERVLEVGGAPPTAVATEAPAPAPEAPAPDAPARVREEPAKPASAAKKPKKQPDPGPGAPPDPTAAGMLDLEKIRRSWPILLEEVRKLSRRLHAYLADATPQSLGEGTLTIAVRFGYHGEQLAEPKNAALLAQALSAAFGTSPHIRTTVVASPEADGEADLGSIDERSTDPIDSLKAAFGEDIVEE